MAVSDAPIYYRRKISGKTILTVDIRDSLSDTFGWTLDIIAVYRYNAIMKSMVEGFDSDY